MNIPSDLLYTTSHEWARVDGDTVTMGITDFAQHQLGDLTFVELPEAGTAFDKGDEIGSVESVKAASEVYSPVTGTVDAVNEELEDAPELVNQDPYGKGWMVRFKAAAPEDLMDAEAYAELVAGEEG